MFWFFLNVVFISLFSIFSLGAFLSNCIGSCLWSSIVVERIVFWGGKYSFSKCGVVGTGSYDKEVMIGGVRFLRGSECIYV